MNELEQKIYDRMLEEMDIDESEIYNIEADTPIFSSDAEDGKPCMMLDSLDALELLTLIYDEWGIDVPAEDMSSLRTIKSIAEYITEHEE